MIVSVVLAPESRAGNAEVGETPTVNVPTLPVNSAAESFNVPIDQTEPGGGLVGTGVDVGVLVGGLAASVGWLGIAKLRLKITRNSRTIGVNMLRLGLTFMANLLRVDETCW
jgi:hypothetical protein